jgi:molecular chaperone Hsp33
MNRPYQPAPPSDFVLPFDLSELSLRGRMTRLDRVATRAFAGNALPEAAERALGEAMSACTLLGSSLRFAPRVSLQTRSTGRLGLLVADYFSGGGVRGYARLDEDAFAALPANPDFAALIGDGHLAITIEQRSDAQTYQGVVALSDKGMAHSLEVYFERSEQLPTLIRLAAGPIYRGGEHGWSAGGLMIQAVPPEGGGATHDLASSDDWQRLTLFLASLEDYELLDSTVPAETVLLRLFHQDEVRVHNALPLHFQCTCTRDKVENVLKAYPRAELVDMAEADNIVRSCCEFCGAEYAFTLDDVTAAPAR